MNCPKCGNEMQIQVVNEVKLVNKHHSIIWWLLIGWWWIIIKWCFFFLPALIIKLFVPKKQKAKNITKKIYVCQKCGFTKQA